MKKAILQFVIIFLASFLSALFGANVILDKIWANAQQILFENSITISMDSEIHLRTALMLIDALDHNQKKRIYQNACFYLISSPKLIDEDDYARFPEKQAEIRKLKNKASDKLQNLYSRGICTEYKTHNNLLKQDRQKAAAP